MSIVVLRSDEALYALREEWQDLFQRCPEAAPFRSPAWLLPWWGVFGTGRPVVAILRDRGTLAGVLPLYGLGEKLLPIGAGITDYQDVLLDPAQPPEAASALLAAALSAAAVDICDLTDLPPGAVLRAVSAPDGWRADVIISDPCPVLTLDASLASVPAGKRRDLRQSRHRAERIGGYQVSIADAESLGSMLPAFCALNARRHPALDPRLRRFHSLAAPALVSAGLLRLYVLTLRGEFAAGYYTLPAPNRLLFYASAFNPEFAHQSPGTLLLGQIINLAIAENRRELHFLRGGEAYKYAWGARDRFNAMLSLRFQDAHSPRLGGCARSRDWRASGG